MRKAVGVFWALALVGCGEETGGSGGQDSDAGSDIADGGASDIGGEDEQSDPNPEDRDASDAEPDALPEAIAWEGTWTCIVTPTVRMGEGPAQPFGPALEATVVTALEADLLTVVADNRGALQGCEATFRVDGETGALDSHTCPDGAWTSGEVAWIGPGFELAIRSERMNGQSAFVVEHAFACAPAQEVDLRTLSVTMVEAAALLITGPEPGIESGVHLCEPGPACEYRIPVGHVVQLMSEHPVGPPVWSVEPATDGCSESPTALSCFFTMDADRAIVVEWPHYEPPRQVFTLTAHMMGYGGFFSFTTDGEPVAVGCSGDCQWEVDAGTMVGATLNSVDVNPDISGQNHTCQIVNSSSWSCQFPMNSARTFSVR